MGTQRIEIVGEGGMYRIVNEDTVKESAKLPENSIDHIVTSIPFGNQYEYSKQYEDLGHNDSNEAFWEQMEYLTPSLYKALKPGRVMCIHVKDRIIPGGMTGLGFQTVYPFHLDAVLHYVKHGFAYLGMKTIVTDVVRENEQTHRLGHAEQCKDGSRMGCGMPEYLLIFRKPQTDRSKGYADDRVAKSKEDYSLGRWQMDAHGFMRSSGDRFIMPGELVNLPHSDIFQMFKRHSLTNVYDFEHDVQIADALREKGKLPVTFMLLQPQSWMDDVWTDVTRMLTLNGSQWSKGKEMHLCPLQFDIVDRCIEQYSMPGETVFDPFGGLMTVPVRAMKKGRKGVAFELNPAYFLDGAAYCKAMENEVSMPTLFDLGGVDLGRKVPEPKEAAQ
jgi:DNA modification methylase